MRAVLIDSHCHLQSLPPGEREAALDFHSFAGGLEMARELLERLAAETGMTVEEARAATGRNFFRLFPRALPPRFRESSPWDRTLDRSQRPHR